MTTRRHLPVTWEPSGNNAVLNHKSLVVTFSENAVFKPFDENGLLRSATVIGPEELDALLNSLEERMSAEWNGVDCARFMLGCLRLIQHCLPPLALDGLAVAQAYWAGQSSTEEVINRRVRCWQALPGEASMKTDAPPVSGIRAVICVLQTSWDPNEMFDLLSFFLSLVNRVEPHYEEQYLLLGKQFGTI